MALAPREHPGCTTGAARRAGTSVAMVFATSIELIERADEQVCRAQALCRETEELREQRAGLCGNPEGETSRSKPGTMP